ncbi:unnamed protein product [Camellia sinensis]
MDLLLPFILSILLLSTSLALSLIFSFFTNKQHKCTQNLPPGKTGWPVIGETLDLILSGLKGHPERFLQERMRQHSSTIFRTSLFGSKKMVFFCGPSANKFLFSNEIKHVATWWPRSFNKVFLSATPADPSHTPDMIIMEESKRFRHLILGFLKLEALQNYIEIMDSVAKRHIEEEWAPKIDNLVVAQQAKLYTFELACRILLRVTDPSKVAQFEDRFGNVLAGVMSLPLDFPGTALNRAIKNADFIRQDIVAIIKKRKMSLDEQQQNNNKDSSTTRDLLAHLLHTADENGKFMNEVEIADKIIGLLIAGYDTASSTLTFILKYLAEYPHAYNEVFKEQMEIAKSKEPGQMLNWVDIQKMKYSWNVACEAMRLAPPSQIGFKEALTDFSFAGFTIPKGWKACWSVHSTHKNPAYFPNPEKFDPRRFEGNGPPPYTFVPFGGGPRMCPGKEYARLEILVFMHNLVTKFKWSKLIPNEKVVYKPNPIPESGLPIRLHPHEI